MARKAGADTWSPRGTSVAWSPRFATTFSSFGGEERPGSRASGARWSDRQIRGNASDARGVLTHRESAEHLFEVRLRHRALEHDHVLVDRVAEERAAGVLARRA